jgi:hypothetical protein
MMTKEEFDNRRSKANQALLDAIEQVDASDPEAAERYKAIAALYHELNTDIKNEFDHSDKKEENAIKKEAIKAESEKAVASDKTERLKAGSDFVGKLIIAATSVFAAGTQLWMFKRSTEKEADEALLTQTDQTIVRNGLSGKFWK